MDQMQAQAEHLGTKFVSDTIAAVDPSAPALQAHRRQRHGLHLRCLDHRHRRFRQLAGPGFGKQISGLWRFGLRHLRRVFLPRQECRRGRRRQYRGRGSAFPHQFRRQGDPDPSAATAAAPTRPTRCGWPPTRRSGCLYDSEVAEVLGGEDPKGVTGIRIRNTVTGSTHDLAVHGLFIAIGHSPATGLFQGKAGHGQGGLYSPPGPRSPPIPQRGGRLCGGRCQGQGFPHRRVCDRGGHGLHGGAGSRNAFSPWPMRGNWPVKV